MTNFKSIYKYVEDLKLNYSKMSEFELLSIAVQMQRNDILQAGFVVFETDSTPSALEAVAIQLGAKPENTRTQQGSLLFEITEIKYLLESLLEKLREK